MIKISPITTQRVGGIKISPIGTKPEPTELDKQFYERVGTTQVTPMKTFPEGVFSGEAKAESYYGKEGKSERPNFTQEDYEKYAERDNIKRTNMFGILKTEIDHLDPIGLLGTNAPENLKTVKAKTGFLGLKNIFKKTTEMSPSDRQGGGVELEQKIVKAYNKGEITQVEGLFLIKAFKDKRDGKVNINKEAVKMAWDKVKEDWDKSPVKYIFETPFEQTIKQMQPQEVEEVFKQKPVSGIERFASPKSLITGKSSEFERAIPGALAEVSQGVLKYFGGLAIEFGLDIYDNISKLAGGKGKDTLDLGILGEYKPYSKEVEIQFKENKEIAKRMGIEGKGASDAFALGKQILVDNTLRATATAGFYGSIGVNLGKVSKFNMKTPEFQFKAPNNDVKEYVIKPIKSKTKTGVDVPGGTYEGKLKGPTLEELIFGKPKKAEIFVKDNNGNIGLLKMKNNGNDTTFTLYAPKNVKPGVNVNIPKGPIKIGAGNGLSVSGAVNAGKAIQPTTIPSTQVGIAGAVAKPTIKIGGVKPVVKPNEITTYSGGKEATPFSTTDKEFAQMFADDSGGTIHEVKINPDNFIDTRIPEQKAQLESILGKEKVRQLISNGNNGLPVHQETGEQTLLIDAAKKLGKKGIVLSETSKEGLYNNREVISYAKVSETTPTQKPQKAVSEVKPTKVVEDTLISKLSQEAKKAKSVDEFVKSQLKKQLDGEQTEVSVYTDKYNKLIESAKKNIKSIEPIGTLGEMFKSNKINDIIGEAKDIPIFIVDSNEFNGRFSTDGFPKIEMSRNNIIKFDETLLEEAIHANQYLKGRIKERGINKDYTKDVNEQLAKRGASNINALLIKEKLKTKSQLEQIYKEANKPTKVEVKKPKLPVKETPKDTSVKLGAGIDPGVDKFIAEDIKPTVKKLIDVGRYTKVIGKFVYNQLTNIFEPIKLSQRKFGYETPSKIIQAFAGKPDLARLDFSQKQLENLDSNVGELKQWFNKNFTKKDLQNFMRSRGKGLTGEFRKAQIQALAKLPKELKSGAIRKAINEIADFNYKYLTKVAGRKINKIEDYFYGIYKDPEAVSRFIDFYRSTERFKKQKVFPTVLEAEDFGLELKSYNPIDNLQSEYSAIAKLEATQWIRNELLRVGEGKYIDKISKTHKGWVAVKDNQFDGLRLEPTIGKLVNNLIATNKITQQPTLNFFRKINNILRSFKFIGSAFHLGVETKQAVADTGFLKFISKTSTRGVSLGFKKNDQIFKTREYRDYILNGGGQSYSLDVEAQKTFSDFVDKINKGNYLGGLTRVPLIPINISKSFINWMFEKYIPKLKYSKYLDMMANMEKKLDRPLKSSEKQEIIKEGQNFYGAMNEKMFGRSATVTTALRFIFMAPGFAEGNYRTIIKGVTQWGRGKTWNAKRSRNNMINSLILTGIIATVGTLIFTGKTPEKPETLDDIRDLLKIDTGKIDEKGRRIMIDMLNYDKDYWNIMFNVLKGRPDKAINESIKRIGGMKASLFEFLIDMSTLMQGKAIVDWKNDAIYEITDPVWRKFLKIAVYETSRLEPISFSVYKQSRAKEAGKIISAIEALSGVRPTYSEKDKRIQGIMSNIFSLREQQEELYYYLGSQSDPREAIDKYNSTVDSVLNSKIVPKEIKEEWESTLKVDTNKLIGNKLYQLTNPTVSDEDIDKYIKWLKNFDITYEEAEKLTTKVLDEKLKERKTKRQRLDRFKKRWK